MSRPDVKSHGAVVAEGRVTPSRKQRARKQRGRGPFFAAFFSVTLVFFAAFSLADDAAPPSPNGTRTYANDDASKNIVLSTEPGDHKLKFRTHIGTRAVEMSYLLHLPADYGDGKKHPMLVFFHGIGECGTDLGGVYALGPMTLLKEDGGNPTFAASSPFIVLCPQCPPRGETWDTDFMYKACAQLVAQTIKKTHTDPDRVYATGLSMGGLGSWCVAEQAPELFAAIAPLSAMAWHPSDALDRLKYVSVWCIVGENDEGRFVDGTRSMQAALDKGPLPQRFMYMVGMGHEAWYPPYQNPQFYEWLLDHHRPDAKEKKKLDATPPPTGDTPAAPAPMPSAPGHYVLTLNCKVGDQPYPIDYVLYLPKGYKPGAATYPAILFLHEQDTIGPSYHDICMHGPDLLLEKRPALQNNFPFVIISPRLPIKCDWETAGINQMLLALVDHVSQSIAIDPDRISVAGINNGAAGAWKLASESPGRFSALVPIFTEGGIPPGGDRAKAVSALPGRAFVKPDNGQTVNEINGMIGNSKMDWRLIKLPETASALGDVPAFNDRQFLTWLEQQKRKVTPMSAAEK
jgi:predicted peptidase